MKTLMKVSLTKIASVIGIGVASLLALLVVAEFTFSSNDVVYEFTESMENGETLTATKVESKSSVLKIVQYRRLIWTVNEDATTLVSHCGNTGFVNRVVNFVLGHGSTLSGGSNRDGGNSTEFYVNGVRVKNDTSYWGSEAISFQMKEACSNA